MLKQKHTNILVTLGVVALLVATLTYDSFAAAVKVGPQEFYIPLWNQSVGGIGDRQRSAIASNASGDTAVAFVAQFGWFGDSSGDGVYVQRFDALGQESGGQSQANTTVSANQNSPTIAMDSSGNFVVAFVDEGGADGAGDGIFAQRFNSSGVAQGSEIQVNTTTASGQEDPEVAMDSSGNFVVTWVDQSGADGDSAGVFAQRYNSAGVAQGTEFQVNTTTAGFQDTPDIAMDSSGNFVIAWTSSGGQDGDENGVFAQRYNSAGVTQGTEFQVNTTTTDDQDSPEIAMDSSGDFIIAFEDLSSGNFDIRAQRYNSAGVTQGTEFVVNTTTSGDQQGPDVAIDEATGDFIVTWVDLNGADGNSDGIFSRIFDSSGTPYDDQFQINTRTNGSQHNVSVSAPGSQFFHSWTDSGSPYFNVFGQIVREVATGTPAITSTVPGKNAYDVTLGSSIVANFTEAVDQSTLTVDTFVVIGEQSGKRTAGSFVFSNGDRTVTFTPSPALNHAGERVNVILTDGIESAATNTAIIEPRHLEFTMEATLGFSSFSFDSRTEFNNDQGLGIRPSDTVIADITGDGNLDLVLTNLNGGLETWVGDGFGGFSNPTDIVISVPGLQGRALAVAPFDDNASLDIAVKIGNDDLRIYLNDGTGSFPSQMTVNFGGASVDRLGPITVNDFNNDGFPDIASGNFFDEFIHVYLNNGGSTMDFSEEIQGTAITFSIVSGDMNKDNFIDIVASSDEGVDVLHNNLDGTFDFIYTVLHVLESAPTNSYALEPFQLGSNDLHIISDSNSNSFVNFLGNDGTGEFARSFLASGNTFLNTLNKGLDVDADGDPDGIVFDNSPGDTFQILQNNSFDARHSVPSFALFGSPFTLNDEAETGDVGDLDGNGSVDLIISEEGGGLNNRASFSVWLNAQTVPATVSDLAASPDAYFATLTWSAPANGGVPITDYIVEFGETAGFPGNAAVYDDGISAVTGATVLGLDFDTDYSFRVFAVNSIGTGGASNVATASTGVTWELSGADTLTNTVNGAAVVEYNNLFYHFGGSDGGGAGAHYDTVNIIDPSAAAGSRVTEDSTDPIPVGLSHMEAQEVGGLIYLLMGRTDSGTWSDTVYIYDPAGPDGGRWSTGTAPGAAFERHSMASAVDGTDIFLFGGFDSGSSSLDEVISYDTALDSWTTAGYATIPDTVFDPAGARIGADFYMVNGSDLFSYNFAGDSWSTLASHPNPDISDGCSFAANGDFYHVSGLDSNIFGGLTEVYKYDIAGDTWTVDKPMNRARKRCAASSLNGVAYVFTGHDVDTDFFDDYEFLDFAAGPPPPPTVPGAISNLAGSPGPTNVSLSWSAPANGGFPITDYIVEVGESSNFPANATVVNDGVGTSTTVNVTGLVLGTEYSFRVFAVNALGTGGASNIVTTITIPGWAINATDPLANDVNGAEVTVFDGKIYHFGGSNGGGAGAHFDTVEIFDPSAPLGSQITVDTTDPMPLGLSHTTAQEVGGLIYILMGRTSNTIESHTVYIYDPAGPDGGRWSTGASAGASFARHSMESAVFGNEIYLFGGFSDANGFFDDVISYNVLTDTWTTGGYATIPDTVFDPIGEKVLDTFYLLDAGDFYGYDFALDSWSTLASHPLAGVFIDNACSLEADNKVYVLGGVDHDAFEALDEVYSYNPFTDTWTQEQSLAQQRKRCAGASLDRVLYAFGGQDIDTGNFLDNFEFFALPPLPEVEEFQVNTTTAGSQKDADIAIDENGNFVIVWDDDNGLDGDILGIFAQRFDSMGIPIGPEFQVNTTTSGSQFDPSVSMTPSGEFVVTWTDFDGADGQFSGVFAQRYDALGSPLGGEFQVNTTFLGSQNESDVGMAADGRFVVTWKDSALDGDAEGIFAQRFDATGTPVGPEFQVNLSATGIQSRPRIGVTPDGRFVIGYTDEFHAADGDGSAVFVRIFDELGVPQTTVLVNTNTTGFQILGDVAVADNGLFVVTWDDDSDLDGDFTGVFAQRFDAVGNPFGPEVQVNTTTTGAQQTPYMDLDELGNFVIAWSDFEGADGNFEGVFAQKYDIVGNTIGTEFQVNQTFIGGQQAHGVAMGPDGRFVIIWVDDVTDGDQEGVFARIFSEDAFFTNFTEIQVNEITEVGQFCEGVHFDSDGNSTIIFIDDNDLDGDALGIFGRRLDINGNYLGPQFQVNTTTANSQVNAQIDGNDEIYAVVWTDFVTEEIYLRIFDANGPLTGEIIVSSDVANGKRIPHVSMNASGTILVVWSGSASEPDDNVFGRLIDSGGTPLGASFQINTFVAGQQTEPVPHLADDGSFIVAFRDLGGVIDPEGAAIPFSEDGDGSGVYMQRYDALGLPIGVNVQVHTTTTLDQDLEDLSVHSDGSFVISWADLSSGIDTELIAQRFDASGNPVGGEFQINTTTNGFQSLSRIAHKPDGGFIVSWQDPTGLDGDAAGVVSQEFDANGNKVGSEMIINTYFYTDQFSCDLAINAGGDQVYVWDSVRQDGSGFGVFARIIPFVDGVVQDLRAIVGGGGTTACFGCGRDPGPDPGPIYRAPAILAVCGNGVVEGGEVCDDGNVDPGDGCFNCDIEPELPSPELVILDLVQPTKEHGLIIEFQVLGMGFGELRVVDLPEGVESIDLEDGGHTSLGRFDYLPNVPTRVEIPMSRIKTILSYDYTRVFHELSLAFKRDMFEYNRIFNRALEEAEIPLYLYAKSLEGEADAVVILEIDTIPPAVSIDQEDLNYKEPIEVKIRELKTNRLERKFGEYIYDRASFSEEDYSGRSLNQLRP